MTNGSGTGTPATGIVALPAGIKLAMLQLVGDLFKYRETISPANLTEVPSYVSASDVLARYKTHFFA